MCDPKRLETIKLMPVVGFLFLRLESFVRPKLNPKQYVATLLMPSDLHKLSSLVRRRDEDHPKSCLDGPLLIFLLYDGTVCLSASNFAVILCACNLVRLCVFHLQTWTGYYRYQNPSIPSTTMSSTSMFSGGERREYRDSFRAADHIRTHNYCMKTSYCIRLMYNQPSTSSGRRMRRGRGGKKLQLKVRLREKFAFSYTNFFSFPIYFPSSSSAAAASVRWWCCDTGQQPGAASVHGLYDRPAAPVSRQRISFYFMRSVLTRMYVLVHPLYDLLLLRHRRRIRTYSQPPPTERMGGRCGWAGLETVELIRHSYSVDGGGQFLQAHTKSLLGMKLTKKLMTLKNGIAGRTAATEEAQQQRRRSTHVLPTRGNYIRDSHTPVEPPRS